MEFPNICVAGIDLGTLENVRLVLPYPKAFTYFLHVSRGGPLELYGRLRISATTPKGRPPESEDHEIYLGHIRPLGTMDYRELWQLLSQRAKPEIGSIFGPALEKTRSTFFITGRSGCSFTRVFTAAVFGQVVCQADRRSYETRLGVSGIRRSVRSTVSDVRCMI